MSEVFSLALPDEEIERRLIVGMPPGVCTRCWWIARRARLEMMHDAAPEAGWFRNIVRDLGFPVTEENMTVIDDTLAAFDVVLRGLVYSSAHSCAMARRVRRGLM